MFQLFQVLILSLAVTLVGSSRTLDAQADDRKGIAFRVPEEPQTLDWNLARTSHETYLIMNLMEGLVEHDENLNPIPSLSERWEISKDGRTYTFYLRNGLQWSDGKPLTSKHFKDSWIRLLDPQTESPYAQFLFDIRGAEAFHQGRARSSTVGIETPSSDRLKIHLHRTAPHFIHIPSFWVTFPIREDLIQKHGDRWTSAEHLVTIGPFLLSEQSKEKIVLKRNSNYRDKTPNFPSVVTVLIQKDDRKARLLFDSGVADFFLNVTTQDLIRSKQQARQVPYLATYYLGFNFRKKPMQNRFLRKAIAQAIDRDRIPAVLQGGQQVAHGWIPSQIRKGMPAPPSHPHQIYAAQGSLAKAGYPEGQGAPSLVFHIEKFDGSEKLSKMIQTMLFRNLGLKIEVQTGKEGTPENADFFVRHWGADFPDAINFLDPFDIGSGNNRIGWRNQGYHQTLAKARNAQQLSKRNALYAEAEALLIEDFALVPLFYGRNSLLVGPRLQKYWLTPLNYLLFKHFRLK